MIDTKTETELVTLLLTHFPLTGNEQTDFLERSLCLTVSDLLHEGQSHQYCLDRRLGWPESKSGNSG